MRLAILTPLFWPTVGGVQTMVYEVGAYAASQGHAVSVWTSNVQGPEDLGILKPLTTRRFKDREILRGIEVRRYPAGGAASLGMGLVYAAAWRLWHARQAQIYQHFLDVDGRVSRLLGDLRAWRPDVVLGAPYSRHLLSVLVRARALCQAPVALQTSLHFEGTDPPGEQELSRIGACDAVLVNTPYEKNRLVSAGVRESSVSVARVPIGDPTDGRGPDLDVALKSRLQGRPYVLFMGRKDEAKGVCAVVEAVARMHRRAPQSRLVLTGRSTPYFEQHVRPLLKNMPWVENLDVVEGHAKRWLMQNARVFSMPSRTDSFGIVYVESWLAGVPVVAADIPAMRDVVQDEVDGRLAPYGDAQVLADIFEQLINDEDKARRMGQAGRAKALAWTADHIVERTFLTKLLELCSARPSLFTPPPHASSTPR